MVMLFAAMCPAFAEDYLQKFDDLKVSPPEKFVPSGWSRIVDSFEIYGDGPFYLAYRYQASGGKDGAFLRVPQQKIVWPEDETEYKTSYDILIPPKLSGQISFYARARMSTSSTYIEAYECSKNDDGVFTRGSLIKKWSSTDMSTSEWREFTLSVDAPAFVGFRLSNVDFDEFYASKLETQVVEVRSMTVSSIELLTPAPLPKEDNKTDISYKVSLTNNGTVPLVPGDNGYSVSIEQYYDVREVIATQPVEVPLAPGASTDVVVTATVDPGEQKTRYQYNIVENLNGQRTNGKWVSVYPYRPDVAIYDVDDTPRKVVGAMVGFGIVSGVSSERHFEIENTGGAPLTITGIDLPDGFVCDATLPLSVEPLKAESLTVSLTDKVKGPRSGMMVVTPAEIPAVSCQLVGAVLDDAFYNVDFENGIPEDMLQIGSSEITDSWQTVALIPEYEGMGLGANTAGCDKQMMLVTPGLIFAEGEKIVFHAAQTAYFSTLKVYYSTDRIEWTELLTIGGLDEYGDPVKEYDAYFSNKKVGTKYGNYRYLQYATPGLPSGKYYIGFETGGARLDNIVGGRLSGSVDDIYVEGYLHPQRGTVNDVCEGRVVIRNFGDEDIAADGYSVVMNVGEMEFPCASLKALPAGGKADLTISCTPHQPGEFPVRIIVKYGQTVISTPESMLVVAEEEALEEKSNTMDINEYPSLNLPVAPTTCFSASQTIYTADEFDISRGTEIRRIAYKGYCATDKVVSYNVKVWIDNTSETKPLASAPVDTKDMDPIYEGVWTPENISADEASANILTVDLPDPFVYAGENIRVIVEAVSVSGEYRGIFFESCSGTSINKSTDVEADYPTMAWNQNDERPVLYYYVSSEVRKVSGVIYDADDENVKIQEAGVIVKSGDVEYYATSAVDGTYSVDILRPYLDYTIAVAKEGYISPEAKSVVFDGKDLTVDFAMKSLGSAGIDAVGAVGQNDVIVDGRNIIAPEGSRVFGVNGLEVGLTNLAPGIYFIRYPEGGCAKIAVK